jgi:hypothetical protein
MAITKSEFSFIRRLTFCQTSSYLQSSPGERAVLRISCFKSDPRLTLKFRTIKDHAASANRAATDYFALLLHRFRTTNRTDERFVRCRKPEFVRTSRFANRAAESSIQFYAPFEVQRLWLPPSSGDATSAERTCETRESVHSTLRRSRRL